MLIWNMDIICGRAGPNASNMFLAKNSKSDKVSIMSCVSARLAPVLKTIFHQCVISYTCSQSYSDGPVLRTLKQGHQSKTGYKYMI